MGYMIEIADSRMESLLENAEQMLRYGGKVMQCLEELGSEERTDSRMGNRLPAAGNGDYRSVRNERDERRDEDRWFGEKRGNYRRY